MINTYQTSLPAPPVPPRLSRSQEIFIPTPLPSQGHSKVLIRFLVGVVLVHLFLSIGGFIILYNNEIQGKPKSVTGEGKVAYQSSDRQETSSKTMARMVVEPRKTIQKSTGYLSWDMDHSLRKNINYYHNSWLTILEPGSYYVYSKVTFSKGDSRSPLASKVKLRKSETEKEKDMMQAFCSLESNNGSAFNPRMCTASQGEVITLEEGNQLSVWVQDLSLVYYQDGATTFGMYKL